MSVAIASRPRSTSARKTTLFSSPGRRSSVPVRKSRANPPPIESDAFDKLPKDQREAYWNWKAEDYRSDHTPLHDMAREIEQAAGEDVLLEVRSPDAGPVCFYDDKKMMIRRLRQSELLTANVDVVVTRIAEPLCFQMDENAFGNCAEILDMLASRLTAAAASIRRAGAERKAGDA